MTKVIAFKVKDKEVAESKSMSYSGTEKFKRMLTEHGSIVLKLREEKQLQWRSLVNGKIGITVYGDIVDVNHIRLDIVFENHNEFDGTRYDKEVDIALSSIPTEFTYYGYRVTRKIIKDFSTYSLRVMGGVDLTRSLLPLIDSDIHSQYSTKNQWDNIKVTGVIVDDCLIMDHSFVMSKDKTIDYDAFIRYLDGLRVIYSNNKSLINDMYNCMITDQIHIPRGSLNFSTECIDTLFILGVDGCNVSELNDGSTTVTVSIAVKTDILQRELMLETLNKRK